jgi:hypothetical protein
MSKDAAVQFFQLASKNQDLQREIRSMTATQELFKLGRRHGYDFAVNDMGAALQEGNGAGLEFLMIPESTSSSEATSRLLHYEWSFDQVSGFDEVVRAFRELKIKPSTADMDSFNRHFRPEVRNVADTSPASPGFRERCEQLNKPGTDAISEFARPWFHLVNLDEHVDHDRYDEYFEAKTRLLKALENFFGDEVRFSGSLWYPPRGYRGWHTNETQPGWRMYLIDFDGSEADIAGKSFFRYMNPQTSELVTLYERPRLMRCFKIEDEKDKLLWHCIVNDSAFSRWSFGFMLKDSWMKTLL